MGGGGKPPRVAPGFLVLQFSDLRSDQTACGSAGPRNRDWEFCRVSYIMHKIAETQKGWGMERGLAWFSVFCGSLALTAGTIFPDDEPLQFDRIPAAVCVDRFASGRSFDPRCFRSDNPTSYDHDACAAVLVEFGCCEYRTLRTSRIVVCETGARITDRTTFR